MPETAPTTRISYFGEFLDDVAIGCDLFRLEQMAPDAWWAAACRGDKATMFWLRWDKRQKRIVVTVTLDDIGCTEVKR
jgi:hypothetical protein